MAQQPVISADSHVHEPLESVWWDQMGKEFGERTPRLIEEHEGEKGHFWFPGPGQHVMRVQPVNEQVEEARGSGDRLALAGYDPVARLEFQKRAGVSAEIINPTFALAILPGPDREVVRAASRVYNDWIADFCSEDRNRLMMAAVIPPDDVDWAVTELKRVREKGAVTAIIPLEPPPNDVPYRDHKYDPIWATAQDLDMPLTLHIVAGNTPHPLHDDPGNAPRGMLYIYDEVRYPLANDFIFGKIFDRFPDLRVQHSEFEISWLPYFVARLNTVHDRFKRRIPEIADLKMQAGEYVLQRLWHVIIEDPYVRYAADIIGSDRIIWGSDFPHGQSVGIETQEALPKIFEGVSDEARTQMTYTNAKELYGI